MGHCLSKSGAITVNEVTDKCDKSNSSPKLENESSDAVAKSLDQDYQETENEIRQREGSASWLLPRSQRQPWNKYLHKEYWEDQFRHHTEGNSKEKDYDFYDVLKGDISNIPQAEPKMFSIFVSSTFTDTEAERNMLIEDVQPYLREVCSLFGYEFRFCEMRWGVRDEASEDHQTANLCMQELRRCQQESRGINFITLLCDKYGYCPFPSEIPSEEFRELLSNITDQSSKDVLEKWFKLDTNKQQAIFILQKISHVLCDYNSLDKTKRKTARDLWWQEFESMQSALKTASILLKSEERKQLYQISVTEQEVYNGLLNVDNVNAKAFMINRSIKNIEDHVSDSGVGKFIDIDWDTKSVNKESRRKLLNLKHKKVAEKLNDSNIIHYTLEWSNGGITKGNSSEYLKEVTDAICDRVFDSIKTQIINEKYKTTESGLAPESSTKKALLDEVSTAAATLAKWSENVLGRDGLLEQIKSYCCANNISDAGKYDHVLTEPLVIFGESGSGKSSLMSLAVKNVLQHHQEGNIVMFRFIGTTSQSGHTRSLLTSIIHQIWAVMQKSFESDDKLPDSINLLANQFKKEISDFQSDMPNVQLILFLDALDQLTDVNMISESQWLPKCLPKNVRIVVSCTPSNDKGAVYFQYLQGLVGKKNFIEVGKMTDECCSLLLKSWLEIDKRKLETEQQKMIEAVFRSCPLPLFMKIAYDETRSWRSYTDVLVHPVQTAKSVEELLVQFFNRLSIVHGKILFERGIAYITAAKHGLSRQELEDIMSCDDGILDDVFQWWIPPIRRIPSLQVVRFLSDLDEYLTETSGFSDGIPLLNWFHRQCRELAIKMTQHSQDTKEIHKTLARYFSGHWAEHGKAFVNKENREEIADRKLPKNQLVIQGSLIKSLDAAKKNLSFVEQSKNDCTINTRRLSELCYHLIKAELWQEVENTLCSLEYVHAKAMQGQIEDLRHEYALALGVELSSDEWPTRSNLADFSSFVLQRGHVISKYPTLVYQEAANYKADSAVRGAYDALKEKPPYIVTTSHGIDDALYGVIEGHNDAVLCVAFQRHSNNAKKIAKCFANGLSEVVSYKDSKSVVRTPIKNRQDSQQSDDNSNQPEHFAADASQHGTQAKKSLDTGSLETDQQAVGSLNLLASGSLDGRIKTWSHASALQITSFQAHTKAVNDCDLVDNLLLSISSDGKMCLWTATDFSQLKIWEVQNEEGSKIAGNACRIIEMDDNVLLFSAWDNGVIRVGDCSGNWLFQTEHKEYPATCFSVSSCKELVIGFADGKILNCDLGSVFQHEAKELELEEYLTEKCNVKEVFNILQYEDITIVAGKEKHIRTQYSEDSNSPWAKNVFKNDQLVQQWVEEGMEYTDAIQRKMDYEMASKGTTIIRKGKNGNVSVQVLEGLPTPHEYVSIDFFFPYLATGGSDGSVRLWLVERSEEDAIKVALVLELCRHTAEVNKLCFSPDGFYLASCSDSNDIQIWDIRKAVKGSANKALKTKYRIIGCATNKSGDYAATFGKRGMVSMWKISEPRCMWSKICCSGEDINSAAITPDGGKVMMAGDNYYELLNGETGRTYDVKRSCVGRKVRVCSFSVDGRTALLCDNCDIRLVVVEPKMKPLGFDDVVWKAHDKPVTCAQFGTKKYFVVSGSEDGKVKFWNYSHECIYEIDIGRPLVSLTYRYPIFVCIAQGEIKQDARFAAFSSESQTQESAGQEQELETDAEEFSIKSQTQESAGQKAERETDAVNGYTDAQGIGNDARNNELNISEIESKQQQNNTKRGIPLPSDTQLDITDDSSALKVEIGNATWFLPNAPVTSDDTRLEDPERKGIAPVNDSTSNFFLNSDHLSGPFQLQDAPPVLPPMPPGMSEEMLQNLQNLQALFMSPPDPANFPPPDIPVQKPGPHRLQKKQKRQITYEPRKKAGCSTLVIFHIDHELGIGKTLSKKTRNGLRNCVASDANTVYASSASGEVHVWRMLHNEWYDIARSVHDNESFVANLDSDANKILVSAGESVQVMTVLENKTF